MLVSIIIPIYNKGEYLEDCISSVVDQSYKDIEIILVNDGSTDNSEIIIDKWVKKDNMIVSITQKNNGVSSARNNGLAKATGSYVFFLDADDKLYKDAIKVMCKEVVKYSPDIIMGNFIHVKKNNEIYRPKLP